MKRLTITSVAVDSPGAGQVTIVASYEEDDVPQAKQQVTMGEFPSGNQSWSRMVRLTDTDLIFLRNGANPVAMKTADSLSKVALALEPTLSWAPKITAQPADDSCVASSTTAEFAVVATSESTLSYQWKYNAKAAGTITSDNTNVADGDTVTIGNKTYTFRTALTPTEGEVLIGANADASLLNLIRAINHTGTPDTDYKCAAAHTQVSAASSVTAHAFAVTALAAGSDGFDGATTETSAHLSWGAATLAGGGWTNCSGTVNGCAYSGGTTATLTCTPTTTGQTGVDHKCVVTNSSGSTDTAEVTLTIT